MNEIPAFPPLGIGVDPGNGVKADLLLCQDEIHRLFQFLANEIPMLAIDNLHVVVHDYRAVWDHVEPLLDILDDPLDFPFIQLTVTGDVFEHRVVGGEMNDIAGAADVLWQLRGRGCLFFYGSRFQLSYRT